jgi:hypothetical protein
VYCYGPLQILISGISPWPAPLGTVRLVTLLLAVGALVTGLACAATPRVSVVAHYWTDVFPAVVLTAEKSLGGPPAILMLSSVDAVPRRDHRRVQQRCSDAAGHAAQ